MQTKLRKEDGIADEVLQQRRDLMPRVLDAYAEDMESSQAKGNTNGPMDSGLPNTLRSAASMLREMQEVTELLDRAGCATGNEHRKYVLLERVRSLITAKNYAWRRYDEIREKE